MRNYCGFPPIAGLRWLKRKWPFLLNFNGGISIHKRHALSSRRKKKDTLLKSVLTSAQALLLGCIISKNGLMARRTARSAEQKKSTTPRCLGWYSIFHFFP